MNRNVVICDMDIEILRILYKNLFMSEFQISLMVGENKEYIKGRLKKLAAAGLIDRAAVIGGGIAVNWITKKGIAEVGLPVRNVNRPRLGRYEHNIGVVDVFAWFSMWRHFKDGTEHPGVEFGSIITERDFSSVKEMKKIGHRADGQPIYTTQDKDIHAPDGYIIRPNGRFSAIEYERTAKSNINILRANVRSNQKRFDTQYWFADDPYVLKNLQIVKSEVGDKMSVHDMRLIRKQLQDYQERIPNVISAKSGIPRKSCLGTMQEPIPLGRLPLLPEYQQRIDLETRKAPADAERSSASRASITRPMPASFPIQHRPAQTSSDQAKKIIGNISFERR